MGSEPRRLIGGKGSAVLLGGEQCELTSSALEIQPRPDPVEIFTPWADEEEKALRRRLRTAWNISTARATRSPSGNARQLWWQVAQVASDWVTKHASKTDLKDVADSLVRMFMAANTFERLEVCDANG
jgi:hypothetical protein